MYGVALAENEVVPRPPFSFHFLEVEEQGRHELCHRRGATEMDELPARGHGDQMLA
jgi:hypothetical protein